MDALVRLVRSLLVAFAPSPEDGRTEEAPGDPAAYQLLYQEARHALDAQAASLDELRARAGILLTAASVVGALLGNSVLAEKDGTNMAGWVGLGLFVLSALASISVLLPAFGWEFQADTVEMIGTYIESDQPATLPEFHRSLAWHMATSREKNERKLMGRYWTFIGAASTLVAGTGLLLWSVWTATH